MNEIRYDHPKKKTNYSLPTIFLAGPTVREHQQHLTSWRVPAVDIFKRKKFEGNVLIPEFLKKQEKINYKDIIEWERNGLTNSDIIMFWIPRTKELIGLTTNYELGYWMGREKEKIVYGHPLSAYKTSYTDVMWIKEWEDSKVPELSCGLKNVSAPIYNSLEKTVEAAIEKARRKKCD